MRISDWSSDVCSSDLVDSEQCVVVGIAEARTRLHLQRLAGDVLADAGAAKVDRIGTISREVAVETRGHAHQVFGGDRGARIAGHLPFGDRKSVVSGKSVSTCRARWRTYTYKKKKQEKD